MRVHHIYQSVNNIVYYVSESAMHYGSRQIGYGSCSVNIHETVYNSDYYYAKIAIHDFEIYVTQST